MSKHEDSYQTEKTCENLSEGSRLCYSPLVICVVIHAVIFAAAILSVMLVATSRTWVGVSSGSNVRRIVAALSAQ